MELYYILSSAVLCKQWNVACVYSGTSQAWKHSAYMQVHSCMSHRFKAFCTWPVCAYLTLHLTLAFHGVVQLHDYVYDCSRSIYIKCTYDMYVIHCDIFMPA